MPLPVLAKHVMVAALLLLLASQALLLAEVIRLDRLGLSTEGSSFALWLCARMMVVALLAIWLAMWSRWAFWGTVAGAFAQATFLALAGPVRPLPYVFLAVVLGAAALAYPLFRSTAGLEEDELASDSPG